jgi:hypothetical protein
MKSWARLDDVNWAARRESTWDSSFPAANLAQSLLVAVMVATAAVGCGDSPRSDQTITAVRSALTATSDVFGFENPADWSTTTAGAVLTQSTTHSQGSFSLQVKPSNSNGFTPIVSTPLSTLTGVSPTLAWDLMLPSQEPNPNYLALLMFEWVRRCGARHDFPSVTVLGEASPERANRCA